MKKYIICTLLIAFVCLSGCSSKYETGYSEGFKAGYDTGYEEGYNQALSELGMSEEEQTYIVNKSSRKFHKPDCSSVSKMKESNKREVVSTRTELIEEGYSPCQQCKP